MNSTIRPLLLCDKLGTPFPKSHPRYGKGIHPLSNHQQIIHYSRVNHHWNRIHESISHMNAMIISLLLDHQLAI